jgi:hypothetical protein
MAKDEFATQPAKLENVPLLIGLEGPPGGGKTFSALRLATGIQRVRGGRIKVIDTEGGRSRKYAEQFDFDIVEMKPPFRSLRFRAAVERQAKDNPACIIIDSLSDEHDGLGGYLKYQEAELVRLVGADASDAKRNANNRRAWIKPKGERQEFVNAMLHLEATDGTKPPVIMTFRAREKTDQKTVDGKTVIENLGFVPIAPSEILYAVDLVCLLPQRADGVPRWRSEKQTEEFVTKLPHYLRPFIGDIEQPRAIDEALGESIARWAKEGTVAGPEQPAETVAKAQEGTRRSKQELFDRAREKCRGGRKVYYPWRDRLTPQQLAFLAEISEELVEILDASDAKPEPALPGL